MYQIVCYQLVPVPLDENLPWKFAGPGRPAGQVETWNPGAIAMVTGANHNDFIQDDNSLGSPNRAAMKENSPDVLGSRSILVTSPLNNPYLQGGFNVFMKLDFDGVKSQFSQRSIQSDLVRRDR